MDNYRNAPSRIAHLLALYPDEVGSQQVDWFWQPTTGTLPPDDRMVLFDHVGLGNISGDQRLRREDRSPKLSTGHSRLHVGRLTHKIEFFWAMSTMAAKHYARHNAEVSQRMSGLVARTLDEVAEMAGIDSVAS